MFCSKALPTHTVSLSSTSMCKNSSITLLMSFAIRSVGGFSPRFFWTSQKIPKPPSLPCHNSLSIPPALSACLGKWPEHNFFKAQLQTPPTPHWGNCRQGNRSNMTGITRQLSSKSHCSSTTVDARLFKSREHAHPHCLSWTNCSRSVVLKLSPNSRENI